MAKLIILYGHPEDPAAFEEYSAQRHLPYAGEHMPHVRGAANMRTTGTPEGTTPPYYRITELTYDSLDDLHAAIASNEGRAVVADLDNFATGGATVVLAEE